MTLASRIVPDSKTCLGNWLGEWPGRQKVQKKISLLEADDFLTEMGKEFQEATLPVSNVEDSSFSEARHGRVLDGSPPRKRQKLQPAEERVAHDSCGSLPQSSVEAYRQTSLDDSITKVSKGTSTKMSQSVGIGSILGLLIISGSSR
ncbi:unnamed protein product [Clonostachys solani]|uniref:Uncharacterized protein n=1 Tax=Clonostachys solani TaxID=160281 RepID=A0A9N9Z7L6_9HYPO|nr:unnamed protein product [Clonostachys solani]